MSHQTASVTEASSWRAQQHSISTQQQPAGGNSRTKGRPWRQLLHCRSRRMPLMVRQQQQQLAKQQHCQAAAPAPPARKPTAQTLAAAAAAATLVHRIQRQRQQQQHLSLKLLQPVYQRALLAAPT
jgi:hypothetical protein